MSDPISLPSVSEVGKLLKEVTLLLTNTPEHVQVRFDRLIADIDAGSLRPSYVADVLATLIRDSLVHASGTLAVDADRRRFMSDVVRSIDRTFGDLLRVSKTAQIYASDLQEIWIACEPMLDLIPEPDGFLDTLVTTLTRRLVQYKYFISDKLYYKDLVGLLESRRLSSEQLGRLKCVCIDKPYVPPVAIYVHQTRLVGFRGRERPTMRREQDGSWQLVKPLDPSWATVLDRGALTRHHACLRKYANSTENPR